MSLRSHLRLNRPNRRRMRLESLETRLTLSVNPAFDQGVLTLEGSREDDSILIRQAGDGSVLVMDGDSGERWEFGGEDQLVQQIVVNAGPGNDKVNFARRGGDTPLPSLDIFAGDGDDDVAIGLLLPAVQKVRDAAARVHVELGAGNDRLDLHSSGVSHTDLDISAGEGDDSALIGLLLPAVQKVRDAAARVKINLDQGDDHLRVRGNGYEQADLDIAAGDGDDSVAIGLLLPAVQKVREAAAKMHVDLGNGNDQLRVGAMGATDADLAINAGDGNDAILIGLLLPAVQKVREAAARVNVDLGPGTDRLRVRQVGYETFEIDVKADAEDFVDLPSDNVRGKPGSFGASRGAEHRSIRAVKRL